MRLFALRGANHISANERAAILAATDELTSAFVDAAFEPSHRLREGGTQPPRARHPARRVEAPSADGARRVEYDAFAVGSGHLARAGSAPGESWHPRNVSTDRPMRFC